MINLFLKAKHWQLFVLVFGIPMLLELVFIGTVFSKIPLDVSINEVSPLGPEFMLDLMGPFFILLVITMLFSTGTQYGWIWSVVIGLKNKLPEQMKMNTIRFKVFFIFPLIYLTGFIIFLFYMMNSMMTNLATMALEPEPPMMFASFLLIIPLHFFAIFCMFHSLYFTAKSFKSVELQRSVSFSDFVGEFFLILFFPIGIWFIQPKVNDMIKEEIT